MAKGVGIHWGEEEGKSPAGSWAGLGNLPLLCPHVQGCPLPSCLLSPPALFQPRRRRLLRSPPRTGGRRGARGEYGDVCMRRLHPCSSRIKVAVSPSVGEHGWALVAAGDQAPFPFSGPRRSRRGSPRTVCKPQSLPTWQVKARSKAGGLPVPHQGLGLPGGDPEAGVGVPSWAGCSELPSLLHLDSSLNAV